MNDNDLIAAAKHAIQIESDAIQAFVARLDDNFARACNIILKCSGRVVVIGVGKSGHVGRKVAATLASTGTPAFYVHPGEASHGDLGMITRQDTVLALSNSGNTQEIITLLPLLKRLGLSLISMTGNPRSALAQASDIHIDVSVIKEACPLNLAPTASTTVTLVAGDALAVTLLEARGFTEDDFALSHPGGTLGKRLLLRTEDIMHRAEQVPRVSPRTSVFDALTEMSRKGFGFTTVVDTQDRLLGLFTDGDLRRALDKELDVHNTPIQSVMTQNPVTISRHTLAAEALNMMETRKISALVVAEDQKPMGLLHMHDLLRAGII